MAARRPFWKWHRWKSIGFCLWPPSTCIWNLKLKFQRKLDLCSGNHVVYRQTDRRTDGQGESSIPPSNFVGRGYNEVYMTPNGPGKQIYICLPMVALLNQTKYSIIPMVIKHLWCATVLIIKQYTKGVAQDSSSSIFAILTFLRILQSVFICFLLQKIIFQLTTLSYLEKC